jgi:hypothetical protein
MSLVEKLYLPKKLMIAGWVMIATLAAAITVEYYTAFETVRCVKTVFIYLLLDYAWTTLKREWLGDWS